MRARHTLPLAIPAVFVVATCAYNPPPAPVSGDPDTIGFLAGEWSGTYDSEDVGRSGDIYFRLRAGADTAQGEVLMASRPAMFPDPTSIEERGPEEPRRAPPVITIRFVRTGGPWVYGELDEYPDPQTGTPLRTTFTGRIEGDRISGQFRLGPAGEGATGVGTWTVRRTGPPPTDDIELDEPGARVPSLPDPGVGPDPEEMIALGRELFTDLGCSFCHAEGRARMAPDLAQTLPHRDFGWIYRMILNPDSMVRYDPVAKGMYEQFELKMPDRAVTPWEALVLYEYMFAEVVKDPPE
ncbi:MAG: hypothetical protein OEU54_15555 [Gemmatimonadota bacterium]|nr:hypothetical protein [Gemmatimonadota bacterium]